MAGAKSKELLGEEALMKQNRESREKVRQLEEENKALKVMLGDCPQW
ncbi:MAG TPA: hypothetical protein V6C81_20400 [Planktothrix sp.]